MRAIEHKGFRVVIDPELTAWIVRDAYGEPCGTIERRAQDDWQAYAPTGQAFKAEGPNMALRQIAIYHGA